MFMHEAHARIRLRQVKDPPRVCAVMKKDDFLSRPSKTVWSTEKYSVVVADEIELVNDLGVKVCSWNKDLFSQVAEPNQFRFYVDEFKEYIYPYVDKKENGITVFKIPFKDCSLADKTTTTQLQFPACEKPKKISKKRKKKMTQITQKAKQ